jgi:hypothetical protein
VVVTMRVSMLNEHDLALKVLYVRHDGMRSAFE